MTRTKFFEGLKDWRDRDQETPGAVSSPLPADTQEAGQPAPVSIPSGDDQQAQGATVRKSKHSKVKPFENSKKQTFENDDIRTFEHSNKQAKKRGNKSEWARAVVTIEPKQYKKIKKECLENDTTFQAFIEGLIAQYFENKGR